MGYKLKQRRPQLEKHGWIYYNESQIYDTSLADWRIFQLNDAHNKCDSTSPLVLGIFHRRNGIGICFSFDIMADFRGAVTLICANIWLRNINVFQSLAGNSAIVYLPPVKRKWMEFLNPSTTAWILVIRPPRLNPTVWFSTRPEATRVRKRHTRFSRDHSVQIGHAKRHHYAWTRELH